MQNRAYSVLEIKAVDDGQRIIRGVATTPSVDRVGDTIDPLGVQFKNPLPFLWQHDHESPVGLCTFSAPTEDGIAFEAKFIDPATVDSVTLKDRLQMAWDSVKTGLVRAVSIGFRAIEYSFMENGGVNYLETEVFELSGVTIPANAEAIITSVKSIDARLRAEHGIPEPEIPVPPESAATGEKKVCVVKLDKPARDRAPFEIKKIHSERKP